MHSFGIPQSQLKQIISFFFNAHPSTIVLFQNPYISFVDRDLPAGRAGLCFGDQLAGIRGMSSGNYTEHTIMQYLADSSRPSFTLSIVPR